MRRSLSESQALQRMRAGEFPALRAIGLGVKFVFRRDGATVSTRVMNRLVRKRLVSETFLVRGRRQTLGDVGKALVRCSGPHFAEPYVWGLDALPKTEGGYTLCPLCLRNGLRSVLMTVSPNVEIRNLRGVA